MQICLYANNEDSDQTVQADLSLPLAHMFQGKFYDTAAHMY